MTVLYDLLNIVLNRLSALLNAQENDAAELLSLIRFKMGALSSNPRCLTQKDNSCLFFCSFLEKHTLYLTFAKSNIPQENTYNL